MQPLLPARLRAVGSTRSPARSTSSATSPPATPPSRPLPVRRRARRTTRRRRPAARSRSATGRPAARAYLTPATSSRCATCTSGPISFTGIVDADTNSDGIGSVILLTNGVHQRRGAHRRLPGRRHLVEPRATSRSGRSARILDAEDDAQTTPDPIAAFAAVDARPTGTDVRGVNITMFAGLGGVRSAASATPATTSRSTSTCSTRTRRAERVRHLRRLERRASSSPRPAATSSSTPCGRPNDVSLNTIDGDINDARNGGAATPRSTCSAETIDLDANDHAVQRQHLGEHRHRLGGNDVEIDSLARRRDRRGRQPRGRRLDLRHRGRRQARQLQRQR